MITVDIHNGLAIPDLSMTECNSVSSCNIPERVIPASPQLDDNGDIVPGQKCDQLFPSPSSSVIVDNVHITTSNSVTLPSPRFSDDDFIMPGQPFNLSVDDQAFTYYEPNISNLEHGMLEFSPVLNNDNTEVKVPYTETNILPDQEPNDTHTETDTLYAEPIDDVLDISDIVTGDSFLNVYTKLVTWYRDLPEGMFISRLLRENESDNELYESRQLLFDALKAYDDFPFDLSSELKRRVGTRRVRLSVKLANDIHKLLSVLEGEEYQVIKELISNAKAKIQPQTPKCTDTPIVSAMEFQMLKDTVVSLQVDMVNLKQTLTASEKLRSEQINTIKNSVDGIKADIQRCASSITESVTNAEINFDSLKATQTKVRELELFLDRAKQIGVCGVPNVTSNIVPPNETTTASSVPALAHQYNTNAIPPLENWSTSPSASDRRQRETRKTYKSRHRDRRTEYRSVSSSGSDRRQPELGRQAISSNVPNGRQREKRKSVSTNSGDNLLNEVPNVIPVVISSRNANDNADDDNVGFSRVSFRRTKGFFIGGYTNSLSIDDLTSYINSCGPTVRNTKVFPLRRTRNKIIVRVNVEANDSADIILNPYLWPRGVVCEPWLSREARKKPRNGYRKYHDRPQQTFGTRDNIPHNDLAHQRNRFTGLGYENIDSQVD